MEPCGETLVSLLNAAGCAPSGDNTQPWRWIVDVAAGRIVLTVDEGRDRSPMNAGQRMARIAIGAALENLLRTAESRGWVLEWDYGPGPALVQIQLAGQSGKTEEENGAITARVTNRCLYDGRPLSPEVLDRLRRETPILEGVGTHWIVDRERLTALTRLIGRADALMFSEPAMRRAFLSQVRFDAPPDMQVAEGLSLASLELTGADRLGLRMMPRLSDWLLKLGGVSRVFAAKARQLVKSASGLCLVVAPDGTERSDLVVGRVMQRAWLALTREGLAAQPMMSLPVLENVLENGSPVLVATLGRDRLAALSHQFRRCISEIGDGRPAFFLRFGSAPAPSGRTGRLPLEAVTTYETPPPARFPGAAQFE